MHCLKITFRWFGPSFGTTLSDIRRLGAEGIVADCQEVPLGDVLPTETMLKLKDEIGSHGLESAGVESVNIHSDIKYGLPNRDQYIANCIQTLKNLAEHDIKVECYHFMQLIDWPRSNFDYLLVNGASALFYDPIAATIFYLFILGRQGVQVGYENDVLEKARAFYEQLGASERQRLAEAILAGMPGSKKLMALDQFKKNHATVLNIDKSQLQDNLAYFLKVVIPEAERLGVKMAIHPDDPPFSVLGVPRIAHNYKELCFILEACPSPSNGLIFCSGALGASSENDLVKIVAGFGDSVHFIHLRKVVRQSDGSLYKADRLKRALPMRKIMKAIVQEQSKRADSGKGIVCIPMHPDHGHVQLDDKNKQDEFHSGYSLIGRALGLAQLSGLEIGIRDSM